MSTPKDIEALPPSTSHTHRTSLPLVIRPFAGRIGGNQEFTISPSSSDYTTIVAKNPDAAPIFTWRESFRLSAFSSPDLWKEAIIEAVGTGLQVYVAGLYATGLSKRGAGPVEGVVVASLANAVLVSLFIFGGAPVSGGHFNPLITMATFVAQLAAFPRAVLYVVFQCAGAVVSGFLLRVSLGEDREGLNVVPGCWVDTGMVTPGEAYTLETVTAFALLFISFGVGLDPRQKGVFGPALSPILVGLALGLCTFATGVAREGYSGASLNPARCLGLMAGGEKFEYHYIHWAGPITAAILNGVMYRVIPIYKH